MQVLGRIGLDSVSTQLIMLKPRTLADALDNILEVRSGTTAIAFLAAFSRSSKYVGNTELSRLLAAGWHRGGGARGGAAPHCSLPLPAAGHCCGRRQGAPATRAVAGKRDAPRAG